MGRRSRARFGTDAPTWTRFEDDGSFTINGEYCLNPQERDENLREYHEEEIARLSKEELTNGGEWIWKDQNTGSIRTDPRYYEQLNEFAERHRKKWHEKHASFNPQQPKPGPCKEIIPQEEKKGT